MSDNNALVSRQASPSSAPVQMQAQTDALMVRAKMIAAAPSDMLPKHYRNNTGAALLLVDWADRNDVSILEAIGEVAFVHGRPVVSAVLQKKLAARSGYRTQVMDSSPTEATVRVVNPDGEEVGRTTYTLDMAKALGIFKGQVWNADPAHMLVKRATTRALEYYGPSELAPLMADPDSDGARAEATVEATASNSDSEPVEAEVVTDTAEEAPETGSELKRWSEDELKAMLKAKNISQADALRAVADRGYEGLSTIAKVADDPHAVFELEEWIMAGAE